VGRRRRARELWIFVTLQKLVLHQSSISKFSKSKGIRTLFRFVRSRTARKETRNSYQHSGRYVTALPAKMP
jgi:hypothetical protein